MDIEKLAVAVHPRYYGDLTGNPAGTIVSGSAYANTDTMYLLSYFGGWGNTYKIVSLTAGAAAGVPMGLLMALTYPE